MELPLYHIDVFTQKVFSGNPAAVCLLPHWLPDALLQSIAAENHLPVTSFLVENEETYHLRWFSPTQEYDLCGHGTLAAAFVILRWVKPWLKEIPFHTVHSGILTVQQESKNQFILDLPARPVTPCAMLEGLDKALGAAPRHLFQGPWWHVGIMESERQIKLLKPDFAQLQAIGCEKIIVTAPGDRVDFVSRYFKSTGPIHEDPATGSAHCSLMTYWGRRFGKQHLSARQVSARGGDFECEWRQDRVLLKSSAAPYLQGTIQVPVIEKEIN